MFEKCSCNHCSGHIEFDASQAGQMVACPHCGLETKLYVPQTLSKKPSQNISVAIKRGANPLGIASLVLGIGACVFCWIPFLGLLAIPLAAIGLLLAVIGITAATVGKKSSLSFQVGGAVIGIVAILIALFVTGGISTLIARREIQSNATNQKIPTESTPTSPGTSANLSAAAAPQSKSPSTEVWSKSPVVQQGDIQIKVEPNSGAIYPNSPGRIATPNDGIFTIKLTNLSKTRKADFTLWGKETFSGAALPTLTDDNGNVYKIDSDLTGSPDGDVRDEVPIYPNSDYEERLTFEKPISNRRWLHLELPASNFGGSGMIRFEIADSSKSSAGQGSQNAKPMNFQQGDIKGGIDEIVHDFTTGESPTERGLIVKTSNFLLIKVSVSNTSSNRIYDYTTLRNNATLTDNKGNNYRKINSNKTVEEYGKVSVGWVAPYPLRGKFYSNSSRISPHTGREDMLGFDIPDSPGDVLHLELQAENFGGTGKIQFEIPVSRIKNW